MHPSPELSRTHRRVNTLEYDLHLLIQRCGLPEVLDGLGRIVYQRSRLDEDETVKPEWNKLDRLLEQATEASLVLANLKDANGEELWE